MINGPSSLSKAAIEKKVAEYGGSVVQNPGINLLLQTISFQILDQPFLSYRTSTVEVDES